MINFKNTLILLSCSYIFFCCSSTKTRENPITEKTKINWKNPDTSNTFSTSTKILKSNIIPDSIFNKTHIEYLTISGMDCDYGDKLNCWMIKEIPAKIKNLKELKSLSLTVNAIISIPNELTSLKKLNTIDLTDNSGLRQIDNLTKIETLEYLWLYGCGLTNLPNNIGNLKKLKQLGLVGNNLDIQEKVRIKNALPNCKIDF